MVVGSLLSLLFPSADARAIAFIVKTHFYYLMCAWLLCCYRIWGLVALDASAMHYSDLLRGSKLLFPGENEKANVHAPNRSQRSKFRERLQLASEEREYQRLTADVVHQQNPVDVQSSFRVQFGIATNLMLGAICMSVVGYVCSQYIVKTKKEQMVVALICGIAMMLLEVCVFVLRSNKADRVLHQRQNYMRRQMTGVGEQRTNYRPIDTRDKSGASSDKIIELQNCRTQFRA